MNGRSNGAEFATDREGTGDENEEDCSGTEVGCMDGNENRLLQRPSPEELKEMLPGVYESLSEESKASEKVVDSTPLMKVYSSLIMATSEQLMIIGKVLIVCGYDV